MSVPQDKGDKKPTLPAIDQAGIDTALALTKPKYAPLRCAGVYFRGELVKDADGNKLPGYAEAGRICTAALLKPRLVAGESNHAAD